MNKKQATILAIFLGIAATLLVIGYGTGLGRYDLPVQSRRLEGLMAESKRLELPMTQAELVGEIPPPEENAAFDVMAAIGMDFGYPGSWAYSGLMSLADLNAEERLAVETYLEENAGALDRVVETVGSKSRWYIERDYDLAAYWRTDEFAPLRASAKALALRSHIRSLKGDMEGAINDFVAIRRLSRLMCQEPHLIGSLVAIALDSIALGNFERLVVISRGDKSVLSSLEKALIETSFNIDPTEMMRGEFYLYLASLRNLSSQDVWRMARAQANGEVPGPDPKKTVSRSGSPRGMIQRASMSRICDMFNDVVKSKGENGKEWRDFGEKIDQKVIEWNNEGSFSELLPAIFFPVFSNYCVALKRHDVTQACGRAFVKAFSSYAQHETWPEDLNALLLKLEDPFVPGQSVKFIANDKEVRVYSVGVDKKDDGGKWGNYTDASGKSKKGDDWGVIWPRAKPISSSTQPKKSVGFASD